MVAKKRKEPKADVLRTPAYVRFEHNLDKVVIVVKQSTQRFRDKHKVMMRTGRRINAPEITDLKKRTRQLEKTAESLVEISTDLVLGHTVFSEWMAVMLMTFVQEYVEESLVAIATKKPGIMKDVAPVDWERIKECQSLDDLTKSVRREWAQSRMRGKKVRDWFKNFESLGAPKFDAAHCATLQHLFDTRNLIIHSASKPSAYYRNTYPSQLIDAASGEMRVTNPNKQEWLECLKHLIDPTDAFVLKFGG